ncbi:hypothetical protein NDU88_002296 [Pleurodeles waltl]|uniref:Solute carrier family 46 member 3 n=1 Tax=Pleurodeles waltl TaxID=8319 RepID=A0AAV7ND91_PLEWA|nr:hypothetical protein NDU88_002296 [Pleurodeles waltl]
MRDKHIQPFIYGSKGGPTEGIYVLHDDGLKWLDSGSFGDPGHRCLCFLGVFLFTKCLKEPYIIFIGLFSWTSGMLMSGFAKTTLLMFLVRVVIVFAFMPLPIFRSMMSKVVLDSEQGALFGCIACLESLTATVSGVVFSCVYATTVMWLPGFSFLLAAGLVLIPMSLVWAIMLIGYEEEQPHTLFINEVESDGGDLLS